MNRQLAALAAAALTVFAGVAPFLTVGLAAAGNADPPTVTTEAPTAVTDTGMTANGALEDTGNATNATVWFEYWREENPGNVSTTPDQVLHAPGTFNTSLAGLAENPTYVVVAHANASDGEAAAGEPVTVTTTADPTVTTGSPTDVTASSATLTGTLSDLGGAVNATVWFAYWPDGDPANASTTGDTTLDSPGTVTTAVSGLRANETYVVEAHVEAADGDTAAGDPVEFATQPRLQVRTDAPTDVTADSATFNGDLGSLGGADNARVGFAYWVAGDPANVSRTARITLSEPVAFSSGIAGLEPNTTYVAVAEATAADGDEVTGEQVTFTTAPADDLSIGVSQGAARVTIAVTREGDPVENATVRVLGGGDAIAVGPYTTDADGTVVLPAPDATVTVTIEAVENGFAGRRTVTLHAQRGHGAPFTPFGQRVSAYVDSLLMGDVPEPLGRLVAAFVTAENPGQGPVEDEPGGTEDAAEDDGHDEDDSRGPPEHARNDDNPGRGN